MSATLNRLQVYVVMPAFFIHFLSTAKQPLSVVWPVFYFGIVQFLILIPIGWLLVSWSCACARGLGADDGARHRLRQRRLLRRAGDAAGLRRGLSDLSVGAGGPDGHPRHARSVSGCWRRAARAGFAKLRTAFETPLIPSIFIGLALRGFEVELPPLAAQPMQFLGSIFTPLALYTLGAQVAAANTGAHRVGAADPDPGPEVPAGAGAVLVDLRASWGCPRDVTDVIVVAAATPVGVLITIFAAEYKTESEFISTAVVISTALSPMFVTGWILATRLL